MILVRCVEMDLAPSRPDGIERRGGLWVLTDGKIGDDVQCLAVATALNPAFEKREVHPRAPWSWMAPWGPVDPREAPGVVTGPLRGSPPAVVIASGRRAIPHALALKRWSGGTTRIAIMKDPRVGRDAADILWTPEHDRVTGSNTISTLTSPHGLSEKIKDARNDPCAIIAEMPRPMLGIILGGPSGGARYGADDAHALARRLNAAGADFASIAVTPSRRTPAAFQQAVRTALVHERRFVWEGDGANPYVDILANAASLIVAGDSHNMVSEALASDGGVYVWRPSGLARKMGWFVDQLEQQGAARTFVEGAAPFERAPIDATPEIVGEIRRRLS